MPNQPYYAPLTLDVASGTQILNSSTETIMFPDYQFAANDALFRAGSCLRVTAYFDSSFVTTTPGTLTLALRWGGVAGTVLATTGAYAPDPTGALANRAGYVEFLVQMRSVNGAASSFFTMGRWGLADVDDASATTLQGNLNMFVFPNTPAAVTVDTSTAKLLSITAKHSVPTSGTQTTGDIRLIESIG